MKVIVLGAGGQLGADLVRAALEAGDEVVAFTRSELDIVDGAHLRQVMRTTGPDVVFNAAAFTAVDRAEAEVAQAEAVNAVGARRVAQNCRDMSVRLVHFSTDYVFDGRATEPIPEGAPTSPVNAYGRSKLLGEQAVQRSGADAWVVRSAWLYGKDGPNFVRTVLRVTRQTGEMRVVDDQRGSPTWTRELASAARRLVEVGDPGVYHLTNSGDCTWYELAQAVVEVAGIGATVVPITTADYPTPARRPAYSVLANSRWLAIGQPPLSPWRDALSGYLSELQTGNS